jgi:hypothetical protein
MEKITTAWRPEGEWIAKLDLVEEGSKLVVKEMDQVGSSSAHCTRPKGWEQQGSDHCDPSFLTSHVC